MINSKHDKHKNYDILNLIGYGLAKFDTHFVSAFGFKTKNSFFEYVVKIGIAETVGTVKNRQDLFDPFFDSDFSKFDRVFFRSRKILQSSSKRGFRDDADIHLLIA